MAFSVELKVGYSTFKVQREGKRLGDVRTEASSALTLTLVAVITRPRREVEADGGDKERSKGSEVKNRT